MNRFIEGEDRRQATLLPDSLEDYVRFPTKPDGYSNRKPDTYSDLKPDSVPI